MRDLLSPLIVTLTKNGIRLFTTILVAGAFSSCSGDPTKAVARGDDYEAAKNHQSAIIEYKRAIQIDPKLEDAHFKLAESYGESGEVKNALTEYLRASDLRPDHLEAQLKAINLLLLSRNYDAAQTRARAVLQREPKNAAALLALGNALAGLKHLDEAVAANERAVELDPKNAGMRLNLGTLQFARGNRPEAEEAFNQAVSVEPQSIKAHLGLADYYWAAHRPVDAEAELKRTLAIDPSSVEANRELAYFYVASSRVSEAETYLRAALRAANDDRSRFDLADYYVSIKRLDDAVAVLQETTPEGESFAPTRLRVAVIQYLAGHRVESLRIIDEVIAKEPKSSLAYSLKAHALLGEHNTQEARTAAEAAVSIDHKSARAQYALGKVELALGELDQAQKAFVEALRLEPSSAEAATELSQLHLSRHEVDSAIQYALQAVKDSPSYLEARVALVRTLSVREEDFPKAEALLRELRQRYPASAEVQIASAELAAVRHNEPSAISDYQRALKLDPDSMPALTELVDRDVKSGHRAEAREALDAALARRPDQVELLVLAGKLYAPFDDAKAEKYLSRAIQLDPANIDAYATLGGVYLTRGKLASARDQFVELTKRQPKSIQPRTMLGILAQTQGNSEEAESWYQKALQIDPRAAVASNNLAWLYAEQSRELAMAQELAEAAHASMPNQLEVTDTLAWVYLKRQSVSRAIPLFQRCLDVEPENAGYHYHLGMAFAQNGEDRKARIELEQALKLKPDFEGAAQAKKLLQQLAY